MSVRRDESRRHAEQVGPCEPELNGEAAGDAENQQDDERFDVAELILLQVEHEQHVERRQADAPHQREMEEQVERDRRADDLREVARGNRHLAEEPQEDRRRTRVMIAARLRQIAAAGDAEARGQRLEQDRHQVRQHDHAEQRVSVFRAARQVGRPIAGVHVADRDEVTRTGEGEELPPETAGQRHRDGAVDLRQTDIGRGPAPAAGRHTAVRRLVSGGHRPYVTRPVTLY